MEFDTFKVASFMKARVRVAAIAMAVCASGAASNGWALTQDAAETQLLAVESGRLDAQVARNVEVVGNAVADDAVYVHANGAVQSKREFLADLAAGRIQHRDVVLTNRTVAIHDDTGITHGTIALTVGADRRIVGSYTGVYALRDGGWKVLSWQTTPIQPRTDAPPAPAPAPAAAPAPSSR